MFLSQPQQLAKDKIVDGNKCIRSFFFLSKNRVMVGLPSVESREKILRTLLAKEKVAELDFKELATMTEGYSGSDLKVCGSNRALLKLFFH